MLVIIDYGVGNVRSVTNAFRYIGSDITVSCDPAVIAKAHGLILPGVGAAAAAMSRLKELNLAQCIVDLKQPVLGICLGMQLLFENSDEAHQDENGVECLGIIPGTIKKFTASSGVRVPHMGWNTTTRMSDDPLLSGLPENPWFYFVHSYRAPVGDSTIATCQHGESFAAIVRQGNFYGAQFHPERSARSGAKLLANFLELQ